MKIFIASLMSLFVLAPALSQACGMREANAPRTAADVEQELLLKIHGKSLSCSGNGATVTATIDVYARYRCMGSPVYGVFKTENSPEITVSKITADDKGVLTVAISDFAEPEICTVK